jgi:hypothetical protein
LPGRLLCLDLGSINLGWAWAQVNLDGRVTERRSGCLQLAEMEPQRWARIDLFAKFVSMSIERGVTWIALEEPHTGKDNVGTRHMLHGLFAFGQVISWRKWKRPARSISRMDVFEATVGWRMKPAERQPLGRKGRAKMRCPTKQEILAAINARHGWQLRSEDEADAVAMLDMVLAEIAGSGMKLADRVPKAPRPAPLLEGLEQPVNAEICSAPQTPARTIRRIVPGGLPLAVVRPVRGRRRAL